MRIAGREIRWSDAQGEQRSLEQTTVTDIGLAFDNAQNQLLGLTESAVPAVYRARQFLADCVASLHLDEYQGKTVVEEPSQIVTSPDPTITYHDFMSQSMLSLIDHGNCYWWIKNRDQRGDPKSVYVINPLEMNVNWDRSQLYPVYSWRDRTMRIDEDLIHIAINRGPGELKGKGPIQAAQDTTLQAAQAEETLAMSLARDNFTPSLVIKSPEVKTEGDAKRVLEIWQAAREANGGKSRPSVMNSNSSLEQVTFSPVDAQWIESRNFTVQQIGRLFGLHGIFLLTSSSDSLTYSTTESLFRLMLTATLRPTYLERIEQSFSRLLPSKRYARFNTDEILRADLVSRYQAHQVAATAGFRTVNEIRADEGWGPLPGGDELIVPSSTSPAPSMNGAKSEPTGAGLS